MRSSRWQPDGATGDGEIELVGADIAAAVRGLDDYGFAADGAGGGRKPRKQSRESLEGVEKWVGSTGNICSTKRPRCIRRCWRWRSRGTGCR